jgi:tRNA(Ile)-lysidine synthase
LFNVNYLAVNLLDQFQRHLATLQLRKTKALVAVSGGPDSVALLDLLVRSRDVHRLSLSVAHVDHGIHPDSPRIAADVQGLAMRYGLPVEIGCLHLGAAAGETAARAERYTWLEGARRRAGADYIFVGHHADDQIETVLMRALRGSGPAGLAAMSERRGVLVRPLLSFRRAQLTEHLRAAGLAAWQDPANSDVRHLRSWLRTDLLPVIRSHLPEADAGLLRLAAHAARDRAAWDLVLDHLLALAFRVEEDGVSMDAKFLASADDTLVEALLLAAARRTEARPGPIRLARIKELLRTRESGKAVPLGGAWRAALSFGRLHFVATSPAAGEPWHIEGDSGERSWGRWRFRWCRDPAPRLQYRTESVAWIVPARLVVRRSMPGERIRPLGGAGRRPVTHCLQECRIPRWRRAGWPIVAAATATGEAKGVVNIGEVVWVPGVCRSDALLPARGADAIRIEVEHV